MKKQLSYILLGSLFFGAVTQSISADDWKRNVLSAVGIGAAVAGAITAANWLFSESDEALALRAGNTYRDISNQYHTILSVYSNISHQGYDEVGLYNIACIIWDTGKKQSFYRSTLSSSKNTLQKLSISLRKRINALAYTNEPGAAILMHHMKEVYYYIEQLLPYIESLSSYLQTHRNYFDLFELDGRIRNAYQNLIEQTEAYRYDEYQVVLVIKRYAVQVSGGRYPLTTFATVLEKDITTLKSALRRSDSRYYNRNTCAQELLDTLTHVFVVLCSDPAYAQEYNNREYERREQERLELQRQQVRIERERLENEQRRLVVERQRVRHMSDHTAVDTHVSVHVNL